MKYEEIGRALVRARFAGSPLSSGPDKTAMLRRLTKVFNRIEKKVSRTK